MCRDLSNRGKDGVRTDQHPSGTRAGLLARERRARTSAVWGPGNAGAAGEMIRLRWGALLVVGVGILFVALSFTGAVAVYAMHHDGQGQTARLHAPVGVRLAEPIVDLKREAPDATTQKEPVAKPLSSAQPPSVQTPTPRATKPAPQRSGSWIHGDKPPRRYLYVGERADLCWRHLRPERRGERDVRAAQ